MTATAKLEGLFGNIGRKKKDSFLAGLLIFSCFYIIGVCLFWLPSILERGNFTSGDGVGIYYPAFVSLRRNLISFFDSLAAGQPVVQMMDFNHFYGSEAFVGNESMYYAFLPYYVFSVFVDERYLPFFFSASLLVTWYLSGISFLYFCKYFKRNMLLAGFFAFFYVFCGNAVYTLMWNVHFYVMVIAFPLIIVGLDKMIHGKMALCFILSVAWLSLAGYPFLVYTLPFAALFALIRIWYVKREKYLLNVLKYLMLGLAHILLGVLMAGVIFIPAMYGTTQGGRSLLSTEANILAMLIPSSGCLSDMFVATYETDIGAVGGSGAVVAGLLFVLFTQSAKKEHKSYAVFMLMCVASPFIWFGINGFSYSICRWGYIPALMVSFFGVTYLPEMLNMDKKGIKHYACYSILLVLLYTFGLYDIAMVEVFVFGILGLFPKLEEKVWNFFCKVCRATADLIARVKASDYRVLRLVVYVIIAVGLIALLTLDYGYGLMRPYLSLYIAVAATIAIMLVGYFKPTFRATSAVSLAALYVVSSVFYYSTWVFHIFVIGSSTEFYDTFTKLENSSDMTNRLSNISDTYVYTGIVYDEEDDDEKADEELNIDNGLKPAGESDVANGDSFGSATEYVDENGVITDPEVIQQLFGAKNEYAQIAADEESATSIKPFKLYKDIIANDQFLNLSKRYGLPTTAAVQSTIDKHIVNLFNRCGQDCFSFLSKIQLEGFYNKEVLYSLFGVNRMYSFYPVTDELFGITEFESDNLHYDNVHFYHNDYALPVGCTYDTLMSKDYFDGLNSAELPYAMYNYAYLEGYDGGSFKTTDDHVAHVCDTELTRKVFLTSAFGNEIANNSIAVNEDVSGCFLYISFDDVRYTTGVTESYLKVSVVVDRERYITTLVETQNWSWRRGATSYTASLGYCENDVNEISFLSFFDFDTDNLVVTAIPVENYTKAYEERTAETLRNVTMGNNKITGDINVSTDKILSVPVIYSVGWKAYVDGVEKPVYMLNDIFLGLTLEPGSHSVVFEYTTPYLFEGLWCSIGAVVVTVGYAVFFAVKKKKKEKAAVSEEEHHE